MTFRHTVYTKILNPEFSIFLKPLKANPGQQNQSTDSKYINSYFDNLFLLNVTPVFNATLCLHQTGHNIHPLGHINCRIFVSLENVL